MATNLARAVERIHALRTMNVGDTKSPHKFLFLIALARLYETNAQRPNTFPLDDELDQEFRHACAEFCRYTEPDSVLIEFPFYHLTTDGVWTLTLRKGKEFLFREYENRVRGRLTRARLIETTTHGSLCREFDECFRDPESRRTLLAVLGDILAHGTREPLDGEVSATRELDHIAGRYSSTGNTRKARGRLKTLSLSGEHRDTGNPFVSYLNTLIRLSAANEGALAEFQARNPLFRLIHVSHPLISVILDELQRPGGRHVVLTGNAGDGKSTIALDVLRRLAGQQDGEPLPSPPQPRENLPVGISILKDLSERRRDQDAELMQEILGGSRRFLIVSNTGALLDFLRGQASIHGVSSTQVESDVLTAISSDGGQADLKVGAGSFLVVNLTRIGNLDIGRQILTRMIDPARWAVCEGRGCRDNCPICLNVDVINHCREIVLDRLFLAYRRMYEYGTRLTLRQMTEHLAYLVTSGLEETDITDMQAKHAKPLKAEFMFFNRFFGDNGKADHRGALEIRAVQEVRRQGFGERPCPTWERKLWLKQRDGHFQLGVEDCDQEFELLREHGSGPGNDSQPGMTPDQAREQVRRMLYFLYPFTAQDDSYLKHFLNSPTLLRWREWQQEGARLEMTEKNTLEQRIYHVLQEHFTGVRMAEGARGQDRRLYITLSRANGDIRQSAQVVVAQVDWSNEISLELVRHTNAAGGTRTDLELQGRGRIKDAQLILTLPFLDYVLMRHFGEVGETLQAAYVERLERFKAQVQDLTTESHTHVMLVRLKTDNTFRRQQYSVSDGKLEVSDVL